MNKNLKKVISTIAAVALSASSLVAFASYDYSDVENTASYYTAVQETSALGIITGYDDGTFQPDKNISRAEVAAMMVRTMGENAVSQADAAEGTATGFGDVPADHWAAKWIKTGADLGYINGVGNGNFEPDSDVTYIQVTKMLVSMCGYDEWVANTPGGAWPTGYLNYGSSLGITDGVRVGQDQPVTRAQVAQMIDNALDAPLLQGGKWYVDNGVQYQEKVQMDGTGKEFQSLLTEYHDTYRVQGRVKEVLRGGTAREDEVKYDIEYAVNFDDKDYSNRGAGVTNINAYIGNSDAADYIESLTEALIKIDNYGEYTILSILPAGRNSEETLDLSDFADDYSSYKNGAAAAEIMKGNLYFYADGSSRAQKYELNTNFALYVNGYKIETKVENIDKYIVNNTVGNIVLTDVPETGKTSVDGKYDIVSVDYYLTDMVDSVAGDTIYFTGDGEISGSLYMDDEATDVTYKFINAETGADMALADIQAYDVLSVKTEPFENGNVDFADSEIYTAYVSRKTAEGTCTSWAKTDDLYNVGGTQYRPVLASNGTQALEYNKDYTIYLDMFNRFLGQEITSSSTKLAVIENVYLSNDGENIMVSFWDKTGGEKQTKALYNKDDISVDAAREKYLGSSDVKAKNPIEQRVYNYRVVSSTNEIRIEDQELPVYAGNDVETKDNEYEYRASSNRIGSLRIGDATTLLDIADYESDGVIKAGDVANLVDQDMYVAYGFDKDTKTNTCGMVLLKGAGSYSVDTNFAVFDYAESFSTDDMDGVKLHVYSDSAKEVIWEDATQEDADALVRGSVIAYKTNSNGNIDEAPEELFVMPTGNDGYVDYADLLNTAINKDEFNDVINTETEIYKKWVAGNSRNEKADLVFGPIMDKTSSSITLGEYDEGTKKFDKGTLAEIAYDSDSIPFILYDFQQGKEANRISMTNKAAVVKTNTGAQKGDIIDFTQPLNTGNVINFAFVKTINGDATQVYVISAPTRGLN